MNLKQSKIVFAVVVAVLIGTAIETARIAYSQWQISKQTDTRVNLNQIAIALTLYRYDNNEYPIAHLSCDHQNPISPPCCTIEEIAPLLDGYFKSECPRLDGWGNPVLYSSSGFVYNVWSPGRDGRTDYGNRGGWKRGFDADIAVVNGSFWSAPEGWDSVGGRLPDMFSAIRRGIDSQESLRNRIYAAADGDASAQYQLGVSHLFGIDLDQDAMGASKWLHNAAGNGHKGAQSMLDLASGLMTQYQFEQGQLSDIEYVCAWRYSDVTLSYLRVWESDPPLMLNMYREVLTVCPESLLALRAAELVSEHGDPEADVPLLEDALMRISNEKNSDVRIKQLKTAIGRLEKKAPKRRTEEIALP